ncbi:MAG TPA: hypothetical protein VFD63_25520 [Pyrinomonadaceae bacterium]|jgi:hypothetical protein|nr:hypothetical protein [Pyrinomonadaceae bacterium]
MTKHITSHLRIVGLVISFALVAGSTAVYGQGTKRQTADIPFQFQVGNTTLPAGEYNVAATTSTGETLRISSRSDDASIFRLSSPLVQNGPISKGKLVFHQYGNEYFLAEVWSAGFTNGRKLAKSGRERTLERDGNLVGKANAQKPLEVIVTLQ